jgi:MFS transporter, FSR family, fosmidomycin resistance protein
VTASLLQPLVGFLTDRKPRPYAMVAGMGATLAGLLLLATAANYATVLISAALIGLGSAIFHPEATRMARHAAADLRASLREYFKSAGMLVTRLVRCWPRQSSLRRVSGVSPGCRLWRWRRSC